MAKKRRPPSTRKTTKPDRRKPARSRSNERRARAAEFVPLPAADAGRSPGDEVRNGSAGTPDQET